MSENNGDWDFLFNPPSDEPYCPYCGAQCYHTICWCPFIKDLNAFSREKTKEMSCGPKEKKRLNFL